MARSLSSLWLKAFKRASRVQQTQSRKLIKSLLPKVAKVVKPRASSRVGVGPKRTRPVLRGQMVSAPSAKTVKPARLAADGAGSWKKSYFSWPSGAVTGGRRMLYALYLPAGAGDAPLPLVVMLHGCQQTADDFAASTRMNALADRKGFAVLYPQQSVGADRHRCWHWYKRLTQKGQGDVSLIAAMVAQVQSKHGLDPSRTYLAGLSAGAGLAALLALNHPDQFAALGLHSAPVFGTADSAMGGYGAMQHGSAAHEAAAQTRVTAKPSLALKTGLPVMLIHGSSDTVVRRLNLHQLTQQFRLINAGAITRVIPERKQYSARVGGSSPRHAWQSTTYYAGRKPQVVSCEITGLGHAWSGGDSNVPFSAREGPNASLMLWRFFTRHRQLSA